MLAHEDYGRDQNTASSVQPQALRSPSYVCMSLIPRIAHLELQLLRHTFAFENDIEGSKHLIFETQAPP